MNILEKSHSNDAFCIADGNIQKRISTLEYLLRRRNNRCLQTNRNGYKPSIRRCRHLIQAHDIVRYDNKIFESLGITAKTYTVLSHKGVKVAKPVAVKKVEVVFHSKTLIGT